MLPHCPQKIVPLWPHQALWYQFPHSLHSHNLHKSHWLDFVLFVLFQICVDCSLGQVVLCNSDHDPFDWWVVTQPFNRQDYMPSLSADETFFIFVATCFGVMVTITSVTFGSLFRLLRTKRPNMIDLDTSSSSWLHFTSICTRKIHGCSNLFSTFPCQGRVGAKKLVFDSLTFYTPYKSISQAFLHLVCITKATIDT